MSAEPIRIRVQLLRPGARMPSRASVGASGFDLHACLEDGPIAVGPDPVRVPTGIAIEAPAGCDVQVRPRSGLAAEGVMVTFGTVDADYRGELLVTMYTTGTRGPHQVRDGDRIAQLVVGRLAAVEWQAVGELSSSERGGSGHGSTGR